MAETIIVLCVMVIGTAIMAWWHTKNPPKKPRQ